MARFDNNDHFIGTDGVFDYEDERPERLPWWWWGIGAVLATAIAVARYA